ncbi:MAG TPA: PspC domain-containing protein [Solirubrobacteraceae bacterium]|nr:PspC domain-containing protein [Solirubrobacteraceae bacterium]
MTDEPRTPEPDETAPTEPQRPKEDVPPPSSPGVRRLTRSSSDKLIGGVAGGLGRYFGVDPILFRIAFVVLTFAGGVGVLAYIGLLAFVPADDDSRPFGARRDANMIGAVLLGIVVLLILGPPFFFVGPALIPIAILIGIGILLWRASGGAGIRGGDPGRLIARAVIALLIGIAAVGAFAGVFVLAALGGGTTLAVLAIVAGVALVVAGLSGGARWLIAPALVLVLPLAIVAAADIRVDGGVGERQYRPVSVDDLRPDYELGMGQLVLDMRDVDLPAGTTKVHLQLGIGHTVVRVPEDACLSSDVQLGAGHAQVLDRSSDGLDVDFEQASATTTDRPRLEIDSDLGIGALEVVRGDDPLPSNRDGWWDDNVLDGPACP